MPSNRMSPEGVVQMQERCCFLRFANVVTSFSCTRFLRKHAPTKCTCMYWKSISKSCARVQLPVTTLAKQRKYKFFHEQGMEPTWCSINICGEKSGIEGGVLILKKLFSLHFFSPLLTCTLPWLKSSSKTLEINIYGCHQQKDSYQAIVCCSVMHGQAWRIYTNRPIPVAWSTSSNQKCNFLPFSPNFRANQDFTRFCHSALSEHLLMFEARGLKGKNGCQIVTSILAVTFMT